MCMHDRYGTTYGSFAGISVLKLAGNSGHYLKGVELNSCSYVLIYRYAFIDSVYIIDLIRVFQKKTKRGDISFHDNCTFAVNTNF